MAATDLIAAHKSMRSTDQDLVAIAHSHPESDPIPSATDLAEAFYPQAAMLIVGFGNDHETMRAWALHPDWGDLPRPKFRSSRDWPALAGVYPISSADHEVGRVLGFGNGIRLLDDNQLAEPSRSRGDIIRSLETFPAEFKRVVLDPADREALMRPALTAVGVSSKSFPTSRTGKKSI